jgi:hypothetical protein
MIFWNIQIIFLLEKPWNRLMDQWSESTWSAHGSMTLIKPESFTRQSTMRIRSTEPVPYDQISHAHRRLDGHDSFFFAWQCQWEQGRGGAMAGARESINSSYGAPNAMWFLPTRSKRWEEPISHAYGAKNRRWKTSDGGAVQPTHGDGERLLRWSLVTRIG